jgi:twitching motility protein PilT
MRDYETVRTAIQAADTGHLVFATLHTSRVYATISRLLQMAPEGNRAEMRAMLSSCLTMVICQRLLPRRGGGIWPCREIMMLNPAIGSMIKEGKERGIGNQLIINQHNGMMEWGKALELAEKAGIITAEEAFRAKDSTEEID